MAARSSCTSHLARGLAFIGLAVVLIGCVPATSGPSASAAASLQPSASGAPATSVCRELDLQLPNGDPLDLNGTWLGNEDSYWTFTQVGDCVWATATDEYLTFGGQPTFWQVYLRGTLLPDFTMPVEYAYSPFSGGGDASHYGHGVLSIEFGPDGSLTLRKTAGCTGGEGDLCPPGTGTLQTTFWTLVTSRVILPPPTPEP